MALYSTSFGFRQPYQVLVDSEICATVTKQKIDLPKQLAMVLQGQVKPMITQCCIHELYLQGKEMQPAVDLAKEFERRKCNHREPIPANECLASVIGETNKHRYVVASQLQPLRAKLRTVPGVPLVHIKQTVLVLEPPSDVTLQQKLRDEQSSLSTPTTADADLVSSAPSTTADADTPRTRKKGPKAPNSLSMKKKVVKAPPAPKARPRQEGGQRQESGKKRKRDEDEGGDGQEGGEGGRKRRRKRKGAGGADDGVQATADEE